MEYDWMEGQLSIFHPFTFPEMVVVFASIRYELVLPVMPVGVPLAYNQSKSVAVPPCAVTVTVFPSHAAPDCDSVKVAFGCTVMSIDSSEVQPLVVADAMYLCVRSLPVVVSAGFGVYPAVLVATTVLWFPDTFVHV